MFWTSVPWLQQTLRRRFGQLLRQRQPATVKTFRRHGNKECHARRCGVTCHRCCGSFEADCCDKFRLLIPEPISGRDGDLRNPGILAESAFQACSQQREARHWTIAHLPCSSFPLYSTGVAYQRAESSVTMAPFPVSLPVMQDRCAQSLSDQCLPTPRSPALVSSRAGLQLF